MKKDTASILNAKKNPKEYIYFGYCHSIPYSIMLHVIPRNEKQYEIKKNEIENIRKDTRSFVIIEKKKMKEVLENFIFKFDFTQFSNILAGVFAFLVAYIKILPQIPRSSTKIISDIDLYEKSKNSSIVNSEIIKKSIEREIQRKYKPPTKIYSYSTFSISLSILIVVGYFAYDRIIEKYFDTTFFFLSLVSFAALVGLISSFDEPVIDSKDKSTKIVRKPVFSFQIFSWGELIGGSITSLIFGFWTYNRFFKNGVFEFDWWGLLTLLFFIVGVGIITGAFKKEKEIENK